jgi:hypothetical protein
VHISPSPKAPGQGSLWAPRIRMCGIRLCVARDGALTGGCGCGCGGHGSHESCPIPDVGAGRPHPARPFCAERTPRPSRGRSRRRRTLCAGADTRGRVRRQSVGQQRRKPLTRTLVTRAPLRLGPIHTVPAVLTVHRAPTTPSLPSLSMHRSFGLGTVLFGRGQTIRRQAARRAEKRRHGWSKACRERGGHGPACVNVSTHHSSE